MKELYFQEYNSHKLFSLSWSQRFHIEQSHFFEHLILAVENLLLHLLPLSDHLQGVAVPVRHEVDPGVDGLKVDAHLHIPDHDRLLACVQLHKHLVRLLSCDRPWLVLVGVPWKGIEGEPGVVGELFKKSVHCRRHLQSVPLSLTTLHILSLSEGEAERVPGTAASKASVHEEVFIVEGDHQDVVSPLHLLP